MLPVPTLEYLANFTGRPIQLYPAFAEQALTQATLLFTVVTGLSDYPEDDDKAQLAMSAILEMADRFVLEQQHQEMLASPYQSETIGSYNYSKSQTAVRARTGQAVGLFWWDLAVDLLTVAGASLIASGSIGGFLTDELMTDVDGNVRITDPVDDVEPPYIRIS